MIQRDQVYIENGKRDPQAVRVLRILDEGRQAEVQYLESKRKVRKPVGKFHERPYADGFSLVENVL
jgi:hypothetical protein